MSPNPQIKPDFCTFTEEMLHEKHQNPPLRNMFFMAIYVKECFFSITLFPLRRMILSKTRLFSLK